MIKVQVDIVGVIPSVLPEQDGVTDLCRKNSEWLNPSEVTVVTVVEVDDTIPSAYANQSSSGTDPLLLQSVQTSSNLNAELDNKYSNHVLVPTDYQTDKRMNNFSLASPAYEVKIIIRENYTITCIYKIASCI